MVEGGEQSTDQRDELLVYFLVGDCVTFNADHRCIRTFTTSLLPSMAYFSLTFGQRATLCCLSGSDVYADADGSLKR